MSKKAPCAQLDGIGSVSLFLQITKGDTSTSKLHKLQIHTFTYIDMHFFGGHVKGWRLYNEPSEQNVITTPLFKA